jgi:hypothetical protein
MKKGPRRAPVILEGGAGWRPLQDQNFCVKRTYGVTPYESYR